MPFPKKPRKSSPRRGMLFISHANPEDNVFTSWLALKLANEGYGVWCDLTKLLGGEDFWKDIEVALRQRTCKYLYVLSKTSNSKEGPRKELKVAQSVARQAGLKDFVIPLRIDDLPHADINIELGLLNAIDFSKGWSVGLGSLIAKLTKDKVPKDSRFSARSVAHWWRENGHATRVLKAQPEQCLTNWFPLGPLPEELLIYPAANAQAIDHNTTLQYRMGEYCVSFPSTTQNANTGENTLRVKTEELLKADLKNVPLKAKDARVALRRLVSLAWERMMASRGFSSYQLSGKVRCYHVTKDTPTAERLKFVGVKGKETWRSLIGERSYRRATTRETVTFRWHFGIHAEPVFYPYRVMSVKPHVLYSDDGTTIWDSAPRLHRARRRYCKDWWNDDWRDRILAMIACIAKGNPSLTLTFSPGVNVSLATRPLEVTSLISLDDEVISQKEPLEVDATDPHEGMDDLDEDSEEEEDV